jgi:hypothetical protein
MSTLRAFNDQEKIKVKTLLATCVAKMMGRKFEEGDWASIYCWSKRIPDRGWSNLHIDVMHNGLGVEHKMLCVGGDKTLLTLAGTTLMHPSATRSIRVESTEVPAQDAMVNVLTQYGALIDQRTRKVLETSQDGTADMRTGWLVWERSLTEFLYFEEHMVAPNIDLYRAEWNERPAKGVRKGSKNLWIYERDSGKKRYSVTTSAGVKIQPYFDVPPPSDPNLCHFRVQSETISENLIRIWITAGTANRLRLILEDPELSSLSEEIIEAAKIEADAVAEVSESGDFAIPVDISKEAHEVLISRWGGVSDEHRVQLLIQSLIL